MLQVLTRALERHDDVVCEQLRVSHGFRGMPHYAVGDMGLIKDITPMRERLRCKGFVEYFG